MSEYFCQEHNTAFFKKGGMKGYAHPLLENGQTAGWCNMKETEVPPLVAEAKKLGAEVVGVAKKPETASTEMSKEDWAEKQAIERRSIERAVALKGAIKLASHDKIELKDIKAYAKKFAEYLDTGG